MLKFYDDKFFFNQIKISSLSSFSFPLFLYVDVTFQKKKTHYGVLLKWSNIKI